MDFYEFEVYLNNNKIYTTKDFFEFLKKKENKINE
jgi:hypothetical protein